MPDGAPRIATYFVNILFFQAFRQTPRRGPRGRTTRCWDFPATTSPLCHKKRGVFKKYPKMWQPCPNIPFLSHKNSLEKGFFSRGSYAKINRPNIGGHG